MSKFPKWHFTHDVFLAIFVVVRVILSKYLYVILSEPFGRSNLKM